jgi:hypothetical protein
LITPREENPMGFVALGKVGLVKVRTPNGTEVWGIPSLKSAGLAAVIHFLI